MKNGLFPLNYQLPEIKSSNRLAKSIINEKNKNLIKKISDVNMIKYQRNFDVINQVKNWTRNVSIKFKKRKDSSLNENKIINNKISTIINSSNNRNSPSYNLTLNCISKENEKEQDSNNNTNFIFSNNLIKLNKPNTNNLTKNIFNSIGDIHNFQEKNKNNFIKKYISNTRYFNSLSDQNTPDIIKQKNLLDHGKINIGKINLFNNSIKQNSININSNCLSSGLDRKNKNRNSCHVNLATTKKIKFFLINEESTESVDLTNKEINSENIDKNGKRKYHIIQKSQKFGKNSTINNIKYKLIVPGIINPMSNNKNINFKNVEDDNKSNNINNIEYQPLLKDLQNMVNLNNMNNFVMILKQHIIIETELNNIIGKIFNQNKDNDSNINMVKSLIDLYNSFFNRLNEISFELNIFVDKDKNILLQKIIKLLIIFHCLAFILIALQDIYSFFLFIKNHYIGIFNNISFCLYNIFMKYILEDLKKYKYHDLSFIDKLNILFSINPKYNIKSTMSDLDIFSLIQKNYLICIDKFIKNLNNNDNNIKEILNSIKSLLLNINKKDLLYFIDICLNNFLYTILNKNIQKAILNSQYNISNKNNCALNSVPYLPKLPPDSKYKFTVVLDMDETLGHFISNEIKTKYFNNYGYLVNEDKYNFSKNYDNKDKIKLGIFLIRPYAKYFLEELNNLHYEIVIFTAGTKEYCDKILDILDLNNNLIKYRLYRSHISLRNINNDVKDLSLLGRNLNKIIIIDNLPENYKLQEDNGLPINSWFGDINDSSLKNLLTIMKFIAEKNVKDVREVVRNIKTQFKNKKIKDYDYGKIDINL